MTDPKTGGAPSHGGPSPAAQSGQAGQAAPNPTIPCSPGVQALARRVTPQVQAEVSQHAQAGRMGLNLGALLSDATTIANIVASVIQALEAEGLLTTTPSGSPPANP